MKLRALSTSLLTILLCFALIAGSTFALFATETRFNIAIGSGKVDVTAVLSDLKLFSMDQAQGAHFENGGTATIDDGRLDIRLMTPGDAVTAQITVENRSNVALKYRVVMRAEGDLAAGLVSSVTVDGKSYSITEQKNATPWIAVSAKSPIPADGKGIEISVKLPEEAGNEFQNTHAAMVVTLEAVQGNAELWDGSSSTAWYDNAPDAEVYEISTAAELAGIGKVLEQAGSRFTNKTVKLMNDIDLSGIVWTPINIGADAANEIVLDGNGKTISGLTLNGDGYQGFFGSVAAKLTVKDLTFENATVATSQGHSAVVVGSHYGNQLALENVDLQNCSVTTSAEKGIYLGGYVGFSAQNDPTANAKLSFVDCSAKELLISGYHSIGAFVGITKYAANDKMSLNGCSSEATLIYSATSGVGAQDWACGADGYQAASFTGEGNTANNKILQKDLNTVYSVSDLVALADRVNGGDTMEGKTVLLAADLDLSGLAWTPIGATGKGFMGTFDGQGHTVSNLDVNCAENGGLFGRVFKGTIKNLNVDNASVYSRFSAGAVAGTVHGDVLNCTVTNSRILCFDLNPDMETGKGDNVGALIGFIADEGVGSEVKGNRVADCYVSGNRDLGMLIGYAADGVQIESNAAENVLVVCNGYSTNYQDPAELRVGGMVGNRKD